MTKFEPEALGEKIDPVILIQVIETLESEKAIQSYLRSLFIEIEDVNKFIRNMEADPELELTQRKVIRLKAILESFKVYSGRIPVAECGQTGSSG
jgi:ribosomal protein L22